MKRKTTASAVGRCGETAWQERREGFARLCEEELCSSRPAEGTGIGTYKEKRLHALLKDFYSPEGARQEVRLSDELLDGEQVEKYAALTDVATRRARDRYVADILTADGEIIEIQTGGFYPLVQKLHFYLCMTDKAVTVVHPIAAVKWVRWMDPGTGEITERRRSPKRGSVKDVARELYWLLPYLAEPRLRLCLPMIEVEETRLLNGWGNGGKRGSCRYDRFALSLCDEVVLSCPQDYADAFLPDEDMLPSPFTAAAYAKATGLRGKTVYSMIRMLCELGFLMPADKQGRAMTWRRRS